MSDNKTPIQLSIEAIEEYKLNEPDKDPYHRGVRSGLSIAIDLIKSHLAIEEEAIKKTCENRLTEAIKHIEQTRKYDFVSIEIRDNGSLWFVGHINIPYEGYDDYEIISVNEYFEKFKPE